ncbi:fibronectin type III domain-containing protein 5 isoform X5 [Ailuropoda melanoleuca]|uniref:fibronectin type III domain-containing protein 5 isoform X5 n=1 Tax=Ailuropoda melanoleuca TaxID=9646 RepID=UPI001494407B|nr:fibronectin type III domain-containing protein 5 isoform X5 [Ailuropoda melanoleuca]
MCQPHWTPCFLPPPTVWPSPGSHLGDRGPGPHSRGCSGSGASPPPDSPSAPVNVTVRHLKANSAVVSWDVLEDEVVIGFAISQQKKDVRMLRFIQEVNTTTRSCALWDLEEDTEYIVHVQAISIQGQSPASEPVLFKTPREAEKVAAKNKGVIALFCRQYDIIKDNEPNNNKEKTKSASETSTPEHQGGGLLRSKVRAGPGPGCRIGLGPGVAAAGQSRAWPWLV